MMAIVEMIVNQAEWMRSWPLMIFVRRSWSSSRYMGIIWTLFIEMTLSLRDYLNNNIPQDPQGCITNIKKSWHLIMQKRGTQSQSGTLADFTNLMASTISISRYEWQTCTHTIHFVLCVCIYIYIYTCGWCNLYVYICAWNVHMHFPHISMQYLCLHVHACMCMCKRRCDNVMYIYTHVYIYICIYIYVYIYTYIHIVYVNMHVDHSIQIIIHCNHYM